jgi:DNA-binding IclR family transcriptional regulator
MLASFQKLAQRIREEYEDGPDLRFTIEEASQFWGLDRHTTERVLQLLLTAGFLERDPDGRYGETQGASSDNLVAAHRSERHALSASRKILSGG